MVFIVVISSNYRIISVEKKGIRIEFLWNALSPDDLRKTLTWSVTLV
jgi:hypothetical protein